MTRSRPFEGFRWRTAKELNVNYVWLYVYTSKPDGPSWLLVLSRDGQGGAARVLRGCRT